MLVIWSQNNKRRISIQINSLLFVSYYKAYIVNKRNLNDKNYNLHNKMSLYGILVDFNKIFIDNLYYYL